MNELQLLNCLRNAIKQASASEDTNEQQVLLGAADHVVNELLLHKESNFYLDFYNQGLLLAREGLNFISSNPKGFQQISVQLEQLPDNIDINTRFDAIDSHIEKLLECLQSLVALLPMEADLSITEFEDKLCEWEDSLYARRVDEAQLVEAQETDKKQIEESLFSQKGFEDYLRDKFPNWTDLKVNTFTSLPGGFSKKTILVETEDKLNGTQSMVIRAQQPTIMLNLPAIYVADEYPIIQLAYRAGAKVARPLWLEQNEDIFGASFIVSEKASGRNLGSALGANEQITPATVDSLAEEVARIHNIDLHKYQSHIEGTVLNKFWNCKTIAESTRQKIKFWHDIALDSGMGRSPLIERGFRWLERNIEPSDDAPVLLHGDYGLHNVLVDNEAVAAILDWEVSHIGDPAEEVAWLLANTENVVKPESLLEAYQRAGGKQITEFRIRYFDVFQCIKSPIASLGSLRIMNQRLDNIQYAIFGLRFMHTYTSRLVKAIKLAEQVKQNPG